MHLIISRFPPFLGGLFIVLALVTACGGAEPTPDPTAAAAAATIEKALAGAAAPPAHTATPTLLAEAAALTGATTNTPTPTASPTDTPLLTDTPPPTETPTPAFVLDFLSLSSQNIAADAPARANLGLAPGLHSLLGIPFETGWTATTQCSDRMDRPNQLSLAVFMGVERVQAVHLLLQAGWGLTEFEGARMGEIVLSFDDGRTITTDLVLGENIRDWSESNPGAVSQAWGGSLREGWRGVSDGEPGHMDILTLPVPEDFQTASLTRIDLNDTTMWTVNQVNPCIHLLATTVEYLREAR